MSEAQLREVQRGFTALLRSKRFPPEWIEEHAPELLAQAHKEFSERLVAGREDDAVGLMICCAWRRALNLLDAQKRRPAMAPLEDLLHLADETTPTPEQEALDRDRQEHLFAAMKHLPERDRMLIALVYFEGLSVREAGRKLGWGKSAADEHHAEALRRLRPLVGDRKLLGVELGVLAFIAGGGESGWDWPAAPASQLSLGSDALALSAHRLAEMWRRLSPFSEPGNAAALGGVGRAAGVCGAAAAAACFAASGVVGPGVDALIAQPRAQEPSRKSIDRAAQRIRASSFSPEEQATVPEAPAARKTSQITHRKVSRATSTEEKHRSTPGTTPYGATVEQTVSEFGLEGGSGSPAETPSAPPPGPSVSSAKSSSPSSAPRTGSSAASSEFGL